MTAAAPIMSRVRVRRGLVGAGYVPGGFPVVVMVQGFRDEIRCGSG
jgi:hypothetical protein